MSRIHANGIELEYESLGDESAPVILMIMGLGAQLVRWPPALLQGLAAAGYRVITFDNRDVGLSTKCTGRVSLLRAISRALLGLSTPGPYHLEDMARDARGLLDGLNIRRAHVIGVSMGGMIGQLLCARFGERVRSFVSVMSTSGSRSLPGPRLDLRLQFLRRRPGADRQARIERTFDSLRRIASPAYPPDENELRQKVVREHERCDCPGGFLRQLHAVISSPSRLALLGGIRVPTLIVHGEEDPLVPVAAAHDLHRRIPGSELQIYAGMGHDLPSALIPTLTARILAHLRGAEERSPIPS